MAFVRSSGPEQTRGASEGACHLYVLPCAFEDLLKLGFSRQPLERMQALHSRFFEFFDLDRALLVETETVRDARRLELELHHRLIDHSAPAPLTVRVQAAGHTEWYRGAYARLAQEVAALGERGHIVHAPLRGWLQAQLRGRVQALYGWGMRVLESVEGEPAYLDQLPALRALRQQVLDVLDAHTAAGIEVAEHLPEALARWYAGRLE
ncbi:MULTISPECIES: GIY-YIG nuclease family protein [unclassified Lysobacter]|uniref:GIY-YIG nuclease family protein n=1 Tax=unclassified Lysobacter TaxID=2635362 RepID=UPI001C238F8E|nr:GIY-YIG nuclease family protein [Lysobacter sp. MMG2]MBU8977977.1 GIY-YIG nuclease family protein [Lysobacter sp. MMG2]